MESAPQRGCPNTAGQVVAVAYSKFAHCRRTGRRARSGGVRCSHLSPMRCGSASRIEHIEAAVMVRARVSRGRDRRGRSLTRGRKCRMLGQLCGVRLPPAPGPSSSFPVSSPAPWPASDTTGSSIGGPAVHHPLPSAARGQTRPPEREVLGSSDPGFRRLGAVIAAVIKSRASSGSRGPSSGVAIGSTAATTGSALVTQSARARSPGREAGGTWSGHPRRRRCCAGSGAPG